jgi:hypothetical protein
MLSSHAMLSWAQTLAPAAKAAAAAAAAAAAVAPPAPPVARDPAMLLLRLRVSSGAARGRERRGEVSGWKDRRREEREGERTEVNHVALFQEGLGEGLLEILNVLWAPEDIDPVRDVQNGPWGRASVHEGHEGRLRVLGSAVDAKEQHLPRDAGTEQITDVTIAEGRGKIEKEHGLVCSPTDESLTEVGGHRREEALGGK